MSKETSVAEPETNGNGVEAPVAPGENRLQKKGGRGKPAQKQEIVIKPIQIGVIDVLLVGDSPLIVHAWSEKAKREMLEKQMMKAKVAKSPKNPWLDYVDSLYWITPKPEKFDDKTKDRIVTQKDIERARFGFPSAAFKSAAVDAVRSVDGMTMVFAKSCFHICGELTEIFSDAPPKQREDMVRLQTGVADIRFRGEFTRWWTVITVKFNSGVISPEQIVNLLNISGFASGVGEHRPSSPESKNGSNGMYHVGTEEEKRKLLKK